MNRNETYFELNTKPSLIDNAKLCEMLKKGDLNKKGWGTNHVIKVGSTKVFAKKIPLTQIEFDNAFSTKNHHDLPMVYNYGIGSAGFGAFRELLLHIKTTNWVLSKACLNFPLMYHYRIIKRTDKPKRDLKYHNRYIKYWNGDKNISKYIKARNTSPYELVLFLEYIPTTFKDYLSKDKKHAIKLANKVLKTIDFLKKENIIHLDMHFFNILTDGTRPYITDFGVGLDKSFDLSKDEKRFFRRHINYDYGEFIGCMGFQLIGEFDGLSKKKKASVDQIIGFEEEESHIEKQEKILNALDVLKANGTFNLTKSYVDFLKKHKNTILLTNSFFIEARQSDARDKLFSSRKLKQYLRETDLVD